MDDINTLLSEASYEHFPSPEKVICWLLGSKQGRLTLLEAMLSNVGQELLADRAEYETIHVLVKVQGDGWVEVMCEDRRVRAEIIDLPADPLCQHIEEPDKLVNWLASPRGKVANYWPTNRRAAMKCRLLDADAWFAAEELRSFELSILKSLEGLGHGLHEDNGPRSD